jgi:hypothetical protein
MLAMFLSQFGLNTLYNCAFREFYTLFALDVIYRETSHVSSPFLLNKADWKKNVPD